MGLFDNISRDIKKLAKLLFWLGIIFTVVYTIWIWAQGNSWHSTFLLGLIGLAEGLLATVIVSFMMYGFGELIEKTTNIDKNIDRMLRTTESVENKLEEAGKEAREKKILDEDGWKCSCGRVNNSYTTTCACGVHKRDVQAGED